METSTLNEAAENLQATEASEEHGDGLNLKPFVCNVCKNSFSRVDHLARHFRSHANKKPHRCDTCNKGFSRADLLSRHKSNHARNDSEDAKDVLKNSNSTTRRSRAYKACVRCAEAKLRCEGAAPCDRCQRKRVPCLYENIKFRSWDLRGSSSNPSSSAEKGGTVETEIIMDMQTDNMLANPETGEYAMTMPNIRSELFLPGSADDCSAFQSLEGGASNQNCMMDLEPTLIFDDFWNSTSTPSASISGIDGNSFMNFLQGITVSPAAGHHPQIGDDSESMDSSLLPNIPDPGHNLCQPGKNGCHQDRLHIGGGVLDGECLPKSKIEPSLKAAQLEWRQLSRDQWNQPPYIYSSGSFENLVPPSRWPSVRSSTRPLLQASTRNRLIATVVSIYDNHHLAHILSCFPSLELLNNLIDNYFNCVATDTDSWLHPHSFDPNNEIAELLTSVITAGALQPNVTELKELGLAFWEINFTLGSRLFSKEDRTTVLLSHLQGLALYLDLGVWSSDRRRVEMSEALSMSGITMARRSRFFKKVSFLFEPPQLHDSPEETIKKWHRWVHYESSKRLASHLIIRDAQISMALNQPPVLYYMEVSLPLPASRDLWTAMSAETWKRAYLEKTHTKLDSLPSLNISVGDFVTVLEHTDEVDTDLSALVILSAIASHTFNYTQRRRSRRFTTIPCDANLIVSSLYQENLNRLESFKATFSDWGREGLEPAIQILYERQLMNLHVSIDDIQDMVEKEGATFTKSVAPELTKWAQAKEGRLAVWHAGQILAATREICNSTLREGSAIAIVHAALVMWVFGILSKSDESKSPGTSITVQDHRQTLSKEVQLDGLGGATVQQFLLLGRGRPVILSRGKELDGVAIAKDQSVSLHSSKDVLTTAVEVLLASHASAKYETALLTHLCELIRKLYPAS